MNRFLLQMAGFAGTGKSTLAQAIVRETGAVLIDKDVIMAVAMRLGIESRLAAAVAYQAGWELTQAHLRDGHSVIFDNPASFTRIRTEGGTLARQNRVAYKLIECVLDDVSVHEARLAGRPHLHSVHAVSLDEVDLEYARPGTSRITEPHLIVDTSQPLIVCVAQALEYLRS
ncbi:MAG TPA: AAA family ATPase [Dehalococcoidia bacterium]|nr:AAA family ATPase [Dehalococcoidia bacterium]